MAAEERVFASGKNLNSRRTGDRLYVHLGEMMWNFFLITCHLAMEVHVRRWHAPDGSLADYAMLRENQAFDCQALSKDAGQGIEAEALAWVEARLAELRRQDALRAGSGDPARANKRPLARIARAYRSRRTPVPIGGMEAKTLRAGSGDPARAKRWHEHLS